ncbi:hypothetical protein ASE75_09915 [Sphingomonas sp. Leaf17]|uniref:hypothetical protein n=1 Tax=Sphingomonas sp. Leaf17 TaxID=1735683 RepID=UPI000702333D|nr:hypothetical protein [Sphingomonas sp. Leaf17]KQM64293.1 hypothetical protein ASE75_09915 [Sphingomonas sp. Leaf17]
MRIRTIMAVVAGVMSAATLAQDATKPDSQQASWKARRDGHYRAAADLLHPEAFNADGSPKPGPAYQSWAELQGMMTGEPGPQAPEPGVVPLPPEPADLAALRTATATDAIAAIVARARQTRIVILNEDHAVPRDRAFGLAVAKALRPLGYDVLAAETFSNRPDDAVVAKDMARLSHDGYIRRSTGTYTQDPVFADFIRQSLALGYRPVAYETTDYSRPPGEDWKAQVARREQMQADYLVRRAVRAYPASKILIHVGFSHATEAPIVMEGVPVRWMATRLKAMTGIDPLTIDQTTLNPYGSGSPLLYAAAADRIGTRPAVLVNGGKPLVVGQYRGHVDLQVAHPATRRIGGRPDWLAAMGRTPTPIPATLVPTKGTRLIQAFVAREANDAVPVDQVLVTAGQPVPMLMLPEAPVRYAVQDSTTAL